MAAIFNFILLILIAIIVTVAVFAYNIYNRIHRAADKFHKQMESEQYRSTRTYGKTGEEEIIIDRRTPQEASKKIFAEDEGEYVDYQEVDDQH